MKRRRPHADNFFECKFRIALKLKSPFKFVRPSLKRNIRLLWAVMERNHGETTLWHFYDKNRLRRLFLLQNVDNTEKCLIKFFGNKKFVKSDFWSKVMFVNFYQSKTTLYCVYLLRKFATFWRFNPSRKIDQSQTVNKREWKHQFFRLGRLVAHCQTSVSWTPSKMQRNPDFVFIYLFRFQLWIG